MNYALWLGYIALAASQVAIGGNVIIGKYLLDVMPIYIFLGLRFFIAAVGLHLCFQFSGKKWLSPYHPEAKVTRLDWAMMIVQGLFGGFLFNYLFLWGLEYTTAMSGGIIGSAVPAIITISAVIFLKEKLTMAQTIAVICAVLGIVVIGLNNPENLKGNQFGGFLGDFLVFLAMFPEAWYSILGKKLATRIRPLAAAMVANWAATLAFAPFFMSHSLGYSFGDISAFAWLLVFLAGILSLLFFWLWPLGLRFVSASEASLFGGFMPISTCLLAVVFLGENLHWMESIGMLVIFFSLWLGSKRGHAWVDRLWNRTRRKVI